jgi:DNA-binding NarL/FixJ family response regulator
VFAKLSLVRKGPNSLDIWSKSSLFVQSLGSGLTSTVKQELEDARRQLRAALRAQSASDKRQEVLETELAIARDEYRIVSNERRELHDAFEKSMERKRALCGIAPQPDPEATKTNDKLATWRDDATSHFATLTPRQRQIMNRVLAGQPSKNIAADLGICQRTVENHRALIMKKTGAQSLPALVILALTVSWNGAGELVDKNGTEAATPVASIRTG